MSTEQFYDEIAENYHLIHGDWDESITAQSQALDQILRATLGAGPRRIVDVACGIGTQTLGLAGLGHALRGSDLSSGAVARAQREAAARGLSIDHSVADMRECDRHHPGKYDVVLACDNALPHLPDDDNILAALGACYRLTRSGGITLVSVRDYAREDRTTPRFFPFGIRQDAAGRCTVFQVWDWDDDGQHYGFAIYFVRDRDDGGADVVVSRARYYAIEIAALRRLMGQAGFVDVARIDDVYFQPVLVGRRPG